MGKSYLSICLGTKLNLKKKTKFSLTITGMLLKKSWHTYFTAKSGWILIYWILSKIFCKKLKYI